MSAEALSKLSLADTMVTARAGASRMRTAPASEQRAGSPSTPPSPPESPLTTGPQSSVPSPTPSVIESAAGVKYNVANFETEVRRRVKRGILHSDIKMKYCRLLDEQSNQYLFYLDDEIQLAIGGRYNAPRCSCGANEGGVACKHIFWMLDQLASGASAKIKGQTLEVAADGSSIQNKDPAEILDYATLEKVAENLDWVVHEGPVPDDEDIEDEIAEMLSVFEPSEALPSEFKDTEDSGLSERSRKFREFKDAFTEFFTEYSTKNLGLLNRLQAIIDPEFQAQVFFEKINARVTRAFHALDQYIAHGPTAAPSEAHNVPICARKLKGIVEAIHDYCQQQQENGVGTDSLALRASSALTRILVEVVGRNHNAYANITWDIVPPEEPEENNLFVCLVGAPAEEGGLFILDTLRQFPSDLVLRNHWEALSSIHTQLHPGLTPPAFMEVFRAITAEGRKRALTEAEGSRAKRTMQ